MIASSGQGDRKALAIRQERRIPPELHLRAFKKLAILNAAIALDNLRVPPGNQLEALRGDRLDNTAFG